MKTENKVVNWRRFTRLVEEHPVELRAPAAHRSGMTIWSSAPVDCRDQAAGILAEIGCMSIFPSEGHLASWAGVSPGNDESVGKQKSTRTRSGNKGLESILCQAAGLQQKQKARVYQAMLRFNSETQNTFY